MSTTICSKCKCTVFYKSTRTGLLECTMCGSNAVEEMDFEARDEYVRKQQRVKTAKGLQDIAIVKTYAQTKQLIDKWRRELW